MIQAFKDFMKGIGSLALGWQLWIALMVGLNMIAPLAFLSHLEAQVTLAAILLSATTGLILTKVQGFTKLLGLMHVYWLALVPFLYSRLESASSSELFFNWMLSVIVVNSLSLVIDTADVIQYFRERNRLRAS